MKLIYRICIYDNYLCNAISHNINKIFSITESKIKTECNNNQKNIKKIILTT